jgi:alpha-galactosidase
MNAIWTGEPSVVYGNVRNDGSSTTCRRVLRGSGLSGGRQRHSADQSRALPAHLAALMQTNINVQTLLTEAILTENRDYVYYATMMDPHTAALGIEEIYALVDDLIASHGDWLPEWLHR